MLWHLKTQVSLDKPLERCEGIILTFGIADARRRDLTNMADAIMDMLVAGSVLSDDNWKVTGKLELVPIFGKNETFVKIIYEAESLPSPEV
jgi:Holliday junction resolvase RusA-like endonuclease